MEKKRLLCAIGISGILFLTAGCQGIFSSNRPDQATERMNEAGVLDAAEIQNTETIVTEDNKAQLSKEAKVIVAAMEKTARLPVYQIDTKAELSLQGNLIQGDYEMDSAIAITGADTKDQMQMHMQTQLKAPEEESTVDAYYTDGWYYADDGKEKIKTQKTADEVMEQVSEITNLVIAAAEDIKNVKVSEEDGNMVYQYTIPSYLAEGYLTDLILSSVTDSSIIEGIRPKIETVTLVSIITKEGNLLKQELSLTGNVKKSLFEIPAAVHATAEFSQDEHVDIDLPSFDHYEIQNDEAS